MRFFHTEKKWFSWLMVGLVLLGAILRSWNYWLFPVAGETQDEYAWSILGASLLQTGVPASWSYFSGYDVYQVIKSAGADFPVVRPALDHPPLFGLLPGLFQTVAGHSWLEIVSIKLIRFPLVLLGIVNLALFAIWLRRLPEAILQPAGKLVALAVFATAPSFVYLSRMVVSENLLVTWMLLLLLLLGAPGKWMGLVRNVVLVLLPLTKVSGAAIVLADLFRAIVDKKNWKTIGLLTLTGLGLFLLYAAVFDFGLFWRVQTQQAQRDAGLLTLFTTQLWSPALVQKPFADIWIPLGYIATFAWLFVHRKKDGIERYLAALFVAQLAFMLLSVGETTVHGWYRIVLLPFFAFSIGWVAERVWERKDWLGLALGWMVVMPVARLGWLAVNIRGLFSIQSVLAKVFLVVAGLNVAALSIEARKAEKLWRFSCVLLALVVLSGNILTVLFLREQAYWLDALYLEQGIRP